MKQILILITPWVISGIFFLGLSSLLYAQAPTYTIRGTVHDQYGPLSGASVSIPAYEVATTTELNGTFELKVSPGTYTVQVEAINFNTHTRVVNTIDGDAFATFVLLPPPVTIGSVGEPVEVITAEELAFSNRAQLSQVLQYLVPAFHSTSQTLAGGTDHIDPISFRGLGPDQVLVLVNGKRWHNSSLVNVNNTLGRGAVSTDLNAIPVSAVDHIEILRDGAATRYGSDAIAGVINIILKEDTQLNSVGFMAGGTSGGDGTLAQFNANYGFEVGKQGYVHVTADYTDQGAINRSGPYTGTVYGDERDQNLSSFFNQTGLGENRIMSVGRAATRDAVFFYNASFPLKAQGEIYVFGGHNYRIGKARGFYRLPKNETQVVSELYPLGFSPLIRSDIVDNTITVGVKGKKNGWTLDFGNTVGTNSIDFSVENSNNASMGIFSPTSTYAGGFKYLQNNAYIDLSYNVRPGGIDSISFSAGGLFRHDRYELIPGSETSWIQGTDTTNAGIRKMGGIQGFPGFQPQNAIRGDKANAAGYLGLDVSFTPNLFLGAALRYEAFNNFGDRINYKLVGSYQARWLELRATYNTGFRAPSVHQLVFSNVGTQFIDGRPEQVGTFKNNDPITRAFGIAPLKPETSNNLSAGMKIRPFGGEQFMLGADYYRIKIEDRIILTGRFAAVDEEGNPSIYAPILETYNARSAQFFTNALETLTRGIDLEMSYQDISIGKSELDLSLKANFSQTQVEQINAQDIGLEEMYLFNREEVSRIETAVPDHKWIGRARFKAGNMIASIQGTHFGEVSYLHPLDGNPEAWVPNEATGQIASRDQVFGSRFLLDAELMYCIPLGNQQTWKIALGANNLFNTFPDAYTHTANQNEGRFEYSQFVQQFGVAGRMIYVRTHIQL